MTSHDGDPMDAFMTWFQSNGGFIDLSAMGISNIAGSGRGAVALRDIPPGHTLFTLPRTLTLSTRTSSLPSLFGIQQWQEHGLHKGWVGLMLCMMWEDAWAHENGHSKIPQGLSCCQWAPYMCTLPVEFDTPMFWNDEELDELKGTAVVDKIGREDAEKAYWEKVVPAIKTSCALFPPSHHERWYTLDAYHRAGSRILSRSFTVSRWQGDGSDNEGSEPGDEVEGKEGETEMQANTSLGSAMDVDDAVTHDNDGDQGSDSDSDSDDEREDPSDVAMVPMADLLNAKWGSENAKLFYEPLLLRMVTTRDIKQGEEIFNTYGDPPNSDLLRRYGHVDFVQLPPGIVASCDNKRGLQQQDISTGFDVHTLGNPSDVVELKADLVVHVMHAHRDVAKKANEKIPDSRESAEEKVGGGTDERIEWWLDEGGDDTFILSYPTVSPAQLTMNPDSLHPLETIPPSLISLIRILLLSNSEFEMAREKGKLPKGKLRLSKGGKGKGDAAKGREEERAVLRIIAEVLKRRVTEYKGDSIEDDERLLSNDPTSSVPGAGSLSKNKRHAIIVRLGEKRILRLAQQGVRTLLDQLDEDTSTGKTKDKASLRSKRVVSRDVGTDVGRSSKKARR